MLTRKSRGKSNLSASWENVPDSEAEQRLLQVYALLLDDLNNPQAQFDKTQQIAHDPGR